MRLLAVPYCPVTCKAAGREFVANAQMFGYLIGGHIRWHAGLRSTPARMGPASQPREPAREIVRRSVDLRGPAHGPRRRGGPPVIGSPGTRADPVMVHFATRCVLRDVPSP